MKRNLIIVMAMSLLCSAPSFGWGKKGHDATAAIAEQHLTPEAKQMVGELLDGKSIVYWANWLDNASNTPEYKYTKTWHYKNVNEGVRYEEMGVNPSGDAVTAIRAQMETLSNPNASKDDKALALKILVHVTGDMHQPMHLGHATDLGGNRIKLKFFDRDTNLHSIWDDALPEAVHKWSYSEWVDQLDRLDNDSIQAIVFTEERFTPETGYHPAMVDAWAKETVGVADKVYKKMPEKSRVRYDEIAWSAPIIEEQILKGGLRLAFLLNSLAQQQ